MKIVILSDDITGGAGGMAFSQAKYLVKRGHEVTFITTVRDDYTWFQNKIDGVKIYQFCVDYNLKWRAYRSLNNRKLLKDIGSWLISLKPDIIHVHNVHTYLSYASIKLAKKYCNKVWMTFHDTMSVHYGKVRVISEVNPLNQLFTNKLRYNPLRNIIIKHYLKFVDRKIAVSEALKKVLEAKGIKNIKVVHNGVDMKEWEKPEESEIQKFKEKYNLVGKQVFFFPGRPTGSKGFLKAEIKASLQGAVLLVAKNFNHEEMKLAYYASDTVLCLPQYIDPLPTVILEAKACGRELITTDCGGIPEIRDKDISELTMEKWYERLCG